MFLRNNGASTKIAYYFISADQLESILLTTFQLFWFRFVQFRDETQNCLGMRKLIKFLLWYKRDKYFSYYQDFHQDSVNSLNWPYSYSALK